MARTKATAKKCDAGKAPRKALATRAQKYNHNGNTPYVRDGIKPCKFGPDCQQTFHIPNHKHRHQNNCLHNPLIRKKISETVATELVALNLRPGECFSANPQYHADRHTIVNETQRIWELDTIKALIQTDHGLYADYGWKNVIVPISWCENTQHVLLDLLRHQGAQKVRMSHPVTIAGRNISGANPGPH